MNDLLPCPFCGDAEQMVIARTCDQRTPYNPADYAYPRVRCKCGVEIGGENWGEPTTAVAAWNRRSPSDSLTQELAAKDKEIEGLRAVELHARAMTKALTGLTANGSEFFVCVGESYYADTKRCVTYVRDRHARTHAMLVEAVTACKDAEAQLTALRSLVTDAAETLEPLAGYAISSIGSDLDGWVVKLADNAQQPTFNDFDRVRRTLSRLNEAVKP